MIVVPHTARDSQDHVVVHDVFWTDVGVHVVLSPNSRHCMESATVAIQYQGRKLDLARKIQGENRDTVFDVRIFSAQHLPDQAPVELLVEYRYQSESVSMTVAVTRERPPARTGIGASTLFSGDFQLFPMWYDYYTRQGIRHFYMYYHGVLTPEVRAVLLRDRPDVTLVQWHCQYRQATPDPLRWTHKAQASQLQHSLHRFGIPNHTHMMYVDLDELLAPYQGRTIRQAVDDDRQQHDLLGFRCDWAATFGGSPPQTLPHAFLATGKCLSYYNRSKNIVNTRRMESVDIHCPPNRNCEGVTVAGIMYHFWCWSGRSRPCRMLTTLPLTRPEHAGQTVTFYHRIANAFLCLDPASHALSIQCQSRASACQWLLEHSQGYYYIRHAATGRYMSRLAAAPAMAGASRMLLVPYPQHTSHYALYDASHKAFVRFYSGSLGTQSTPLHKFNRRWPCEEFAVRHV